MGRLDHTVLLERGPLWHSFLPYLHTGQNNKNKDKKKNKTKTFCLSWKLLNLDDGYTGFMILFFLLLCIEFLNNTKTCFFYRMNRTRLSQTFSVLHQLPGHPSPTVPHVTSIKPNSTVRQVSTSIQVLVMEGSIPLFNLQRLPSVGPKRQSHPFLGKEL